MTRNTPNTQTDGRTGEPKTGHAETVAGHDVIRPDTVAGVSIDAVKRRDAQRGNPVEDVIGRRTNVAYHVVPRGSDRTDEIGVLVTLSRVSKADSWTNTCLRGSARELNTSDDVTVEAYVSPLTEHTTLPESKTYDSTADPHAELIDGPATMILPDERLRIDNVDPDETNRHRLIPKQATWFRLDE